MRVSVQLAAQRSMQWLLALIALVLPHSAMAQTPAAPSTPNAAKAPLMVPFAALDSPAQIAFRKLAPAAAQTGAESGQAPIRVAAAEKIHPDLITRLEEIRVYGRNEPEDFVGPKKSPLMQFRARLEGEVTLSPAKKAQLALCLIGLCSIYGPDGIPVGDSPERRAEARIVESTLSRQVRGTLQ